jgi:MoxR-like ATPase
VIAVERIQSIQAIQEGLTELSYITDPSTATSLYLALHLKKPLLLEGEAGVGKTEIAKCLAELLDTKLIRLQCYEGLDANHALYEWDYMRQMVTIRLAEAKGQIADHLDSEIFGSKFLLRRPLLEAIDHQENKPVILLIDEIDRTDEEFEAYLLEILSDFQVTIPEMGTIKANYIPIVILTSNRTRNLSDALKRRCLYHWVPYPSFQKELAIIQTKLPEIPAKIATDICRFMQLIRKIEWNKVPGIAETIDWAKALLLLGEQGVTEEGLRNTIGSILKDREDIEQFFNSHCRTLIEAIGLGS